MRRPSRWPRRRPMDCHQVAQVLQTYLDGEIDAVTAVRISRHLEACRRCGMELRAYHEIKQALASRLSASGSRRPRRLASACLISW